MPKKRTYPPPPPSLKASLLVVSLSLFTLCLPLLFPLFYYYFFPHTTDHILNYLSSLDLSHYVFVNDHAFNTFLDYLVLGWLGTATVVIGINLWLISTHRFRQLAPYYWGPILVSIILGIIGLKLL